MNSFTAKVLFSFLMLASVCRATANYKLSCDDGNILEGPMVVRIHDSSASAEFLFSGPGDAFFSGTYKNLSVENLKLSANGKEIESAEIVANHPSKFKLVLKENIQGEIKAHVSMVSTDEDKMRYAGEVTCQIENL